jgi:hypothetical protein
MCQNVNGEQTGDEMDELGYLPPQQFEEDDQILRNLEIEFGPSTETEISAADRGPPFRLAIQTPRAEPLSTYSGAGRSAFELTSVGQDRVALVVIHGLTPFGIDGRKPSGVWGIGYSATFPDQPDIQTKEWLPVSKEHEIGSASTLARSSLRLAAKLGFEAPLLQDDGAAAVEGRIIADADWKNGLALNAQLRMKLLEVIAGGDSNGVAWQMYRQGSSELPRSNFKFLQLITAPQSHMNSIRVEVRTWARARGWFGVGRTTQWNTPDNNFLLAVE